MPSLISSNYLARKPIEVAIKNFAKRIDKDQKILDIGCGYKPYQHYFSGIYTGVDHDSDSRADVVCDSTKIPLPENSFDAIISTQTLEHTVDVRGTVQEIKRLLKPGGLCLISAPMAVHIHGESHVQNDKRTYVDFWRFTKYGLLSLFEDFEVESIQGTSGYGATMMQFINYFFASFGISYIFAPMYLLNNITGILLDALAKIASKTGIASFRKTYDLIYTGFPLNYCLILKKK